VTSEDELGGCAMALEEVAAIASVVASMLPAAAPVLEPRFDRVRQVLKSQASLIKGYLTEESQRLDREAGEQELDEEAKLRAELDRFHESGQASLLPADPVPHDDL